MLPVRYVSFLVSSADDDAAAATAAAVVVVDVDVRLYRHEQNCTPKTVEPTAF